MIPSVHRLLFRLITGFTTAAALSTSAAPAPSAWSVQVWQTEDGLPNNTVVGIAQTPDGFLWIATRASLARFDGERFEELVSTNFFGTTPVGIETLLMKQSGELCVALNSRQVLCLRTGAVQLLDHAEGRPGNFARTMAEDAEGRIWIGYASGELCRSHNGALARIADSSKAVALESLVRDRQGKLWFARGTEVGVWRDERFEVLRERMTSPLHLAAARSGGVWIASGFRIFRFDEGHVLEETVALELERPAGGITALLEDRTGALWIGTSHNGLFRFSQARIEGIPVSDRHIHALHEDGEGGLWVGTADGGLNLVRPRVIQFEAANRGVPFEAAQSVCEDTNGVVWATTRNGLLLRRTGDEWTTNLNGEPWPNRFATCVAAGREGDIWIGTQNRELRRRQSDRFSAWNHTDGLVGRHVQALLVSSRGDVWIGGGYPDSLQCFRRGQFVNIRLPKNAQHLETLAEDDAGNIWVGASKGVLLRVKDDEVSDETFRTLPMEKSIRAVYCGPDGSLWIGYAGGGVGRLKAGRFARVLPEQGLPSASISQIIPDDFGRMWFGSDAGIFHVNRVDLEGVLEGRLGRVSAIRHHQSEGLPESAAIFGGSPGACRGSDGRLWMPLRSGLAIVSPEQVRENPEPPRVRITRVAVDERTAAAYAAGPPHPGVVDLGSSRTLRIPPGHRRITFDFTALSFGALENVQFRYRLAGFEQDWVEARTQRSVSYPRLPAGDYLLRVQACSRDGIWNEQGAVLSVVVTPFAWQTWWFRFGAVALLMSMTIAAVRYVSFRRLRVRLDQLQQQAALDKERARIARNIHDDLGSRLTQITMLSTQAQREDVKPERVAEHVRQISSVAQHGIQSLDETVWAVNPRNDTLSHLVDYIGQFAVEFLRAAGIRHEVELPKQTPDRIMFADARHNVFLVVKEALNNIVRHAAATKVELRVTFSAESMNIVIRDDGRGFAPGPRHANADGLRNMQQRMADSGGRLEVESRPGAGTRIALVLPWPAAK